LFLPWRIPMVPPESNPPIYPFSPTYSSLLATTIRTAKIALDTNANGISFATQYRLNMALLLA
jgi:hypothetical protein